MNDKGTDYSKIGKNISLAAFVSLFTSALIFFIFWKSSVFLFRLLPDFRIIDFTVPVAIYCGLWYLLVIILRKKFSSAPEDAFISHCVLVISSNYLILALAVLPEVAPKIFASFRGFVTLPFVISCFLSIGSSFLDKT